MYILLPVVIIVWGIIANRLVKYIKQDTPVSPAEISEEIRFKPENFKQDTFSIVANYRDPFLGAFAVEHPPVSSLPKAPSPPKPVVVKNIKWPVIAFKGLIKNHESQKIYGMMTIDGKLRSVLVKDEILGIKVLDIQRDSIGVVFNNEKRSFRKK